MAWFNISAEAGLWGLFIASFLAATLLPGGSEALLFALLKLQPEQYWPALLLATLGNTLGGMTSYACGRWLPDWHKLAKAREDASVRNWGAPILLLAWVPLIGDALCVAAGWLRLDWRTCMAWMAAGKFLRYWLIAQAALWQ